MQDFLTQLMTGAIDLNLITVVYDNMDRRREEDTVMLLVDGQEPQKLDHKDAQSFRRWYRAALAGVKHGKCLTGSPSLLNSQTV